MTMPPAQVLHLPVRDPSLVDLMTKAPEAKAAEIESKSKPKSKSKSRSGHIEYNDREYIREVLQLGDNQTESLAHAILMLEAEALGITISRPVSMSSEGHVRTDSADSQKTQSTGVTSIFSRGSADVTPDTSTGILHDQRPSSRRSLSFSEYGKYLEQTGETVITHNSHVSIISSDDREGSLFSVSTRKSYISIKNGLKKSSRTLFRLRRGSACSQFSNSCVCCREDFDANKMLNSLPCLHRYCDECLRVLLTQSMNDESKMPPRCCTLAIPGNTIKSVLTRDDQRLFIKSVVQFSTPWESRIYCPNAACGEFIPNRARIDPKYPFELACPKCLERVCSTCKRATHGFGQDCPADWELEMVLKMGEKSGWKRCYKCRNLVELSQGCSHITCRCKAQFCYICGAVWDQVVGCPNYCNGEEELERRRMEEEARLELLKKERAEREEEERIEAAERAAAEKRSMASTELNALRARQINERDRFTLFERKMKFIMWTRHSKSKLAILGRYGEMFSKMKERHAKTSAHLEDRQVAAEMELRSTHKQAERSVRIRLRHMEAYCEGIGRTESGSNPARVVTERDLRELGQQYNVRDDLERLHQSKINVMRDKQAKQMEQLVARQEEELHRLGKKQDRELEILAESFTNEEDEFYNLFQARRDKLRLRWDLSEEIMRKKLEAQNKVKYGPMPPIQWPQPAPVDEKLESVVE
ncbi:hypothetical protein HYFRA_00007803 [Hymenoscyphus fraxineus]|uniref:RBR-type E3 ubiquitin transferase n=1 Tax=Hymenoscyphus fraxineus TaxID=746836 RepID=A0A9N9KKW8_9HELO|nr:hypothetical protein HYFRA_00007803 [Hymenoscyphus fraxineus]